MITAVKDALNSKKALGAMATLASATWLAQQHIITGDQWTEIVKWTMTGWLGAQGAVDVVKALAARTLSSSPFSMPSDPPGGIFGGNEDVGSVPTVIDAAKKAATEEIEVPKG
jgi:hypothetical protein